MKNRKGREKGEKGEGTGIYGLSSEYGKEWSDNTVFANHPYGKIRPETTCVCLIAFAKNKN